MSMRQELAYDLHVWWRRTVPVVVAVVVVGLVLGLAATFWMLKIARSDVEDHVEGAYDNVPVTAFAAGVTEVFGCISQGPSCAQYADALEFVRTNPARNLTYTPATPTDPGTVNQDGTHTIECTPATSEADIVTVADAITTNGRLGSIDPSAFTDAPDPDTTGMRAVTATVTGAGGVSRLTIRLTVTDTATIAVHEVTRQ